MFITLSSTLFFLYPLLVNAVNDWSTPCRGSCSYETGNDNTTAWGSILLDGATETISDISTAAGWSIMDCNSTSTDTQVIRIVCHDPDAGCDHLFEGGAEETIVRLPEECANAPFARVVNVTSSDNQTLTSTIAKRMTASSRRRSTPPEVLTMTIDYKFSLIPSTRGNVSMTALGTTNPLQRLTTNTQALRRALGYSESGELNARSANSAGGSVDREMLQRDFFADFVGGNKIPAGTTWGEANSTGPSKRDLESRLWHWDKDWNEQYQILNIQESYNVLDETISCPKNGDVGPYNAEVKIDADVDARATLSVGFAIAGSVIPPKITRLVFTMALDGGIKTVYTISTRAHGSFDTGVQRLFISEFDGIEIPGILDFGPRLTLSGRAIGNNFNVFTDATVTSNYGFPGLSTVYPQQEGPSTGQASPGDVQNPLTLSISSDVSMQGQVIVHVIPCIELVVSFLDGIDSVSAFLQLDGYGELDINLVLEGELSPGVETVTTTVATITPSTSTSTTSTESASEISFNSTSTSTHEPVETSSPDNVVFAQGEPDYLDSYKVSLSPVAAPNATTPTATAPAATGSCSARPHRPRQQPQPPHRRSYVQGDRPGSYNGCISVGAGVDITAGLQGALFETWREAVSWDLFQRRWNLLNKCFSSYQFGTDTAVDIPKQRQGPPILNPNHKRQISGLACPGSGDSLSTLMQII